MSLVEVIIASAIVLFLSVALISANLAYYKSSNSNVKTVKSIYLVEEGIENASFLMKSNWSASLTSDIIDQTYNRQFTIETVNRDANSDINQAGGTLDSNTKKLTVQVSYRDSSGTTTKSISTYVFKTND